MRKPALLGAGALVAALVAAALWALFAGERNADPRAPGEASPSHAPTASPRAEAPPAANPGGPSPAAPLAGKATPAGSPEASGAREARVEVEVPGALGALVDLSWETRSAEGHRESVFARQEVGAAGLAVFELAWKGDSRVEVMAQVRDRRGREVYHGFEVEAGRTRRERIELPQTPILEVRKPPAQGRLRGMISLRTEEGETSLGLFQEGGDGVVVSPSHEGPARVLVRAALLGSEGKLEGWVFGEQEVELKAGVRTQASPTYAPMASLRVSAAGPDGVAAGAAQFAIRCAAEEPHGCQTLHQVVGGGLGGSLSFEDEDPAPSQADPAPLRDSYFAGEEVFLRPGRWRVVVCGNDPSLARASGEVTLAAGERRQLELRLPRAERAEVRLPSGLEEAELVVEGPPGASARLEGGLLRVHGLQKGDAIRVRLSCELEEEFWGQALLLKAGASAALELSRAGELELTLRRRDGSPSDLTWEVFPETPADLGRYRRELDLEDSESPGWLVGEAQGRIGPLPLGLISSDLFSETDETGVSLIKLLPGSHQVVIHDLEGPRLRVPIRVVSGQRLRVERQVE